MNLGDIRPNKGARRPAKRVGRGPGGTDKTSGRGHKGQQSRSGSSRKLNSAYGTWGGQVPLIRKLPKRGFRHQGPDYQLIQVGALSAFPADARIDRAALEAAGLVRGRRPIKLLAVGEISAAYHVEADLASRAAKAKVTACGGTVTETARED